MNKEDVFNALVVMGLSAMLGMLLQDAIIPTSVFRGGADYDIIFIFPAAFAFVSLIIYIMLNFVQHLLKRNTLTYWKVNQSTILTILEIITGMTAAMIAGTYRLFDRKLFLIGLAIFLSYMIWWRLTGMPITLTVLVQSANQTTAYYNDLYVNLLEILH